MKAFPVNNLEPGRYFTKQVYLDEKYILLSPETEVTPELINRLKHWRYPSINTEGDFVETPITSDEGGEQVALSIEEDIQANARFAEAQKFYNELLTFIERIFTNFMTRQELPNQAIGEMVKKTSEMIRSHRRYILRLTEMKGQGKSYIVDHSAKTTILSVSMGITAKLPPFKLIDLGTAAMVHEIGMIKLPPQLWMTDKTLTPEERRQITAHTVLGFKILKSLSFSNDVSAAVLECHEHVDGSGYPQKLTGDRIGAYGRIINVAGSYAAITSIRPFREKTEGHSAIVEMLQQKGKRYDEQILKALVITLSIYPIGTYVQLKNGTRGMVVDTNPANPRTPHVKVLLGPNGEAFAEHPVVDTAADEQHAVLRALPSSDFDEGVPSQS